MTFKGKVVVVTDAGSAVGAAVARALHSRGALVLAVDVGADLLAPLAAQGVEVCVADVTRADDVIGYTARAVGLWGGIDLFFNSADCEGPEEPLTDYPLADFDQVVNANLRPIFLGLKYVLPHMRDGGAVVNLASEFAVVPAAGLSGYVASKHGVLGLTRVAALECERRNIRVNAVCPGRDQADADVRDGYQTPEEVADLVVFLLSDQGPVHHRLDGLVDLRTGVGRPVPSEPEADAMTGASG